jgi:hypothetical protein
MKTYIAMGVFAFLVAIISLLRIMSDTEFYRLASMKKMWGRSKGLALHFVSNVVLPLVFGIVFLSGGISGVKLVRPLIAEKPFAPKPVVEEQVEAENQDPLLDDFYTILAA